MKRNKTFVVAGTVVVVSVLLAMSFVGTGPSDTLAQGTNATNATGAAGGAAGGPITVVMPVGSSAATSGVGYQPNTVTVSPGATIIWDNQDNALHTATYGDPETATPDGKFDTGYVAAGQQSKPIAMPTEPGEYKYFCTLHPFLAGTVVVR